MLPKNRLCALMVPLLLCSCAGIDMREDSATPPAYAPQAEYATQVAMGECAFTRQEEGAAAAISSALLSNAITSGVNHIGMALTAAAKEQSLVTQTSRNIVVKAETFGPCVQVVRGWFHQDPYPITSNADPLTGNPKFAAAQSWFSDDFINLERFRTLWLRNQLWLAAPPEFVFEGRIAVASDNTLTIAPQYVRMDEPLFTRKLRRDRSRHVAVFLAFHKPDTAVDVVDNPGAAFVIGKLDPGEARTYPDPRTIDRFTPTSGFVNRWPHESKWFTLAVGKENEPWVVSAAVTEKQSANEFLGFVAEVFGNSKETIASELQTVIVPKKRADAKESATAAREMAENAYDTSHAGALQALTSCATADAPTPEQASAARAALRSWNKSARDVNKAQPASQSCINRIGITAPAAEVKSACEAALAGISSATPTC
jgi:hypothetical protein